jgi:hypothetical protein
MAQLQHDPDLDQLAGCEQVQRRRCGVLRQVALTVTAA